MNTRNVRVWDLPTRLFHWLLAVLVVAAYITGQIGGSFIEWHGKVGIAITGLLAFRLVWGVIGSTYARFADGACDAEQYVHSAGAVAEGEGQGHHAADDYA